MRDNNEQTIHKDTGLRNAEPNIASVRKWIEPSRACIGLDKIRLSSNPIKFEGEKSSRTFQYVNDSVQGLKRFFAAALENENFLKTIAFRDDISASEIKELIPGIDIYSSERMALVIRNDIDPDSIPVVLKQEYEASDELVDVFTAEPEINLQLAKFIALHTERPFIQPHQKELGELFSFIETSFGKYPSNKRERLISEFSKIIKHENGQKDNYPSSDISLLQNRCEHFVKKTGNYFEVYTMHRWNSQDESWGTLDDIVGIRNFKVKDFIKGHAEAIRIGEYMIKLYGKTEESYEEFFPELFNDPKIKQLVVEDALNRMDLTDNNNKNANGHFSNKTRKIRLQSETRFSHGGDEALTEEAPTMMTDILARRKVGDVIIIAHELSHAIYDETVIDQLNQRPDSDTYVVGKVERDLNKDPQPLDTVLSEGFALVMEINFIDKIIANPHLINLDSQDLEALRNYREARLKYIKTVEKDSYYGIGYHIMSVLQKQIFDSPEKSLKSLLERISYEKIKNILVNKEFAAKVQAINEPTVLESLIFTQSNS